MSAAMRHQTDGTERAKPSRLSPSCFMRNLRSEYYSDSEDKSSYSLDAPLLEFQLETITQRNQTHDFELFCRKLCERAICPNLRPQTGPEGGGDSKADSETYPVADEITSIYIGEPNSGHERWAFAFSAKERWAEKVRADVKGLAETGRKYDRIICVTSRSARAKDRVGLEDELTKQYQVPVTIHDRSWIVKEVIEGDRKDLAFNYLHVGQEVSDPLRLGPSDYSRTRQLADIERALANPDAFQGMERQRVTEALVAAKLSRNLERPRTETDGRFIRAIRLAEADGSAYQKLEAHYEALWTEFWWFDDVNLVNQSYSVFEKMVLGSTDARDYELLGNLFQLLVNSVIHKLLTPETAQLDARAAKLRQGLEAVAADGTRPNNALEAQTSLLILRLGMACVAKKKEELPTIWTEFGDILDKASGMGEFDADRSVRMIEVAGQVAGDDPAYGELIEKVAAFVSARKGEAEGALVLLKCAQNLDFDNNFEMLRLLGKAVIDLSKREYAPHLIEALQLLTMAYRSAGLLWAARATCASATASLVIEGEKDGELPAGFVPTMKLWAWIALELGYVPDFLSTIQLLNGALAGLPLTEDSKRRVQDDLRELDLAFGSKFLTLSETELRTSSILPDLLERLGLFMARSALLHALGYSDVLRTDGSLPAEESDEDARRIYSIWASQPVAQQIRQPFIWNDTGNQVRSTSVLGMAINLAHGGTNHSILAAEVILAALEAFFATAIEHRVAPHTEGSHIELVEGAPDDKPVVEAKEFESLVTVHWPISLSLRDFEKQDEVRKFLLQIAAVVLHHTCATKSIKELIQTLFANESVMHRIAMISTSANSYSRAMAKVLPRLQDWPTDNLKAYPLRDDRSGIEVIDLAKEVFPDKTVNVGEIPTDHRALSVRSVIDVHAWDKAEWKGVAYAQFRSDFSPSLALMFKDADAARRIFAGWRERFGVHDEKDEIYIGVVRSLSRKYPHHYGVIVTSRMPENSDPRRLMIFTTRSLTMEAKTDVHLTRFLDSYARFGAYYLLPVILDANGEAGFLTDLAILKRALAVKQASEVSETDVEAILLWSSRRGLMRNRQTDDLC